MESVKRREIISGRRRQVRPPPDRGRGSRNCAVPAVLPPGLFPFGNVCISLAPPSCYFAASSTADLALSYFISDIYYIYTHTAHTCLLPTSTCYFTATSWCFCCCCPSVFFLLFDFGGFFFLNYCTTKLLLLVLLLWPRPNFIRSRSLSPSLSFFLPFSLPLSFALLHCALKLVFVCFTVDTKTCARVCVRSLSLTQAHSLKERAGLLLDSFLPLVAPTDCCCCWTS